MNSSEGPDASNFSKKNMIITYPLILFIFYALICHAMQSHTPISQDWQDVNSNSVHSTLINGNTDAIEALMDIQLELLDSILNGDDQPIQMSSFNGYNFNPTNAPSDKRKPDANQEPSEIREEFTEMIQYFLERNMNLRKDAMKSKSLRMLLNSIKDHPYLLKIGKTLLH